MRDDEALLNGNADEEGLRRRCHLAMWSALYDQALIQTARHEVKRHDLLTAAARVWYVRGDQWDEIARDCQRAIHVTSPRPWRFELRLQSGSYSDDAIVARFDMDENGHIRVTYKGWDTEGDEDDLPRVPPSAPWVSEILRPADAKEAAIPIVRKVLGHLSAQQAQIPTKEQLDALQAHEEAEAAKPRFGPWPRTQSARPTRG
jgi:hypothetical protein